MGKEILDIKVLLFYSTGSYINIYMIPKKATKAIKCPVATNNKH